MIRDTEAARGESIDATMQALVTAMAERPSITSSATLKFVRRFRTAEPNQT